MRRPAFTLVELLVAVVIIGLLTSVATTSYISAQRNARDNARKTSVNAISTAVEGYYSVKRTFPGLIDAQVEGGWENYTTHNQLVPPCQYIEHDTGAGITDYPYIYSYVPLTADVGCDKGQTYVDPVTSKTLYRPSDYGPFPNWIPGLGEFLNPVSVERRFSTAGGDGAVLAGSSTIIADMLRADDTTNAMRTYQYRKLRGGYIVSARLENQIADSSTVAPGTIFNDEPMMPAVYRPTNSCVTVTGGGTVCGSNRGVTAKNVYIVRK